MIFGRRKEGTWQGKEIQRKTVESEEKWRIREKKEKKDDDVEFTEGEEREGN